MIAKYLSVFTIVIFPETSTVTESEIDTEVDTDYESFTDKWAQFSSYHCTNDLPVITI